MNVLLFLLIPGVVAAVVIGINAWRQRRPRSIEAGMRQFREGLDALDPKRTPISRGGKKDGKRLP
jgi:hypothetical protein